MPNKAGFTLVEIIVASVVFALAIAGLLSVFVAGSQHIIHARERITSAELGKLFIDPFQNYVSQDTWNSPGNCLNTTNPPGTFVSLSSCSSFFGPQNLNNRNFSVTYQIANDVPANPDLRRVTAKIVWTEPAP